MLQIPRSLLWFTKYLILLMCCCWIMHTGIASAQEQENSETMQMQDMDTTDDYFDFEVGPIEVFSNDNITVNGEQFLITTKTRFNNYEGNPLEDTSSIREGVEVAISHIPYEDTAIAVDLIPDSNYQQAIIAPPKTKKRKRKKEIIVFKNGVYRN